MSDDLAAPVQAVPHQVRIVFGGDGVHGDGGCYAVLLQHVQQAEDAHPVSVFPVGNAGVVGKCPRRRTTGQVGDLKAAGRRLPFHVFQHQDDAEGDRGIIRPAQGWAADYGRPFVVRMIHAEGSLSGHIGGAPGY